MIGYFLYSLDNCETLPPCSFDLYTCIDIKSLLTLCNFSISILRCNCAVLLFSSELRQKFMKEKSPHL